MLIVLRATSEQALAALAPVADDERLHVQLHTLIEGAQAQLDTFAARD
jgi:hypothetical protein